MFDEESLLPDALRADRRRFVHRDIYEAADWYDVDYAAYRAELTFYRLLLGRHARGKNVVEIGAGTGRLTLPLCESGFFVHAVEPSPSMRALLVHKLHAAGIGDALDAKPGVVVEAASAHDFKGPGADVGLVVFAFNGLLHLQNEAELTAALRHVHDVLDDDGAFAVDITPPYWETLLRGSVPWGRVDERIHPKTGRRFLTCDRSRYEPKTRTTQIDIRYAYVDATDADVGTQIALQQRMWTTPEILQALDDNDFDVDACFGDVDLSAFTAGSPRLLVSAKKRRC